MLVGVLGITWVSAGEAGINYLLGAHGCAPHAAGSAGVAPTDYYLREVEDRPLAVWIGGGLSDLGYSHGDEVILDDAKIIFGQLCDPAVLVPALEAAEDQIRAEGLDDDAAEQLRDAAVKSARLGSEPRKFRSAQERADARIAAEEKRRGAELEPERRAEIERQEEEKGVRKPNAYADLTFSAQKSVSVLYAALLSAGRADEAALVMEAHYAAMDDALAHGQNVAGFSRVGYHSSNGPDRPSTGRYVDAHGWIAARFDHFTSREGEVQLHSHVTVLNRVRGINAKGEEEWLTLDSKAITKARAGIAAVYERSLEERLTAGLMVEFRMRPDGKAREIVGVSAEMLAAHSTRRVQINARLEKYVQAYRDRNGGAEPSAYVLARMADTASLATRRGKEKDLPMDQLISRWEAITAARVGEDLASALTAIEAEALAIRLERASRGHEPIDTHRVITRAIESVQSERAEWNRSDLMMALNRQLPDHIGTGESAAALLSALANEALSGSYGVVQTKGFEINPVPESMRRTSDGQSIYRPGDSTAYSTVGQLTAEETLLNRARTTGEVPALAHEIVDTLVIERGLVGGQAEAVRGVLTDGRSLSLIEGPAGTGKTTVTRAIRAAWEAQTGGRVIGFGPSEISAQVLGDAGIATTLNTMKFLFRLEMNDGSFPSGHPWAVRRGDLVVVDEAAMVSTDHLEQIHSYARRMGAKILLLGDPAQLSAVEAGGAFRLMVNEGLGYELDEVYRFREADGSIREWEAEASLGLRAGDVDALEAYDRRGRIEGGTAEAMTAAAVEAFVADLVSARNAVVSTATNEQATEVAMGVRDRLVSLGKVEPGGVHVAGGRQLAGAGDLVQARLNDSDQTDSEGRRVVNRYVYRIDERHSDGSLTVTRFNGFDRNGAQRLGGSVRLTPEYVREHLSLAYASTTHGAQGRTVDRAYLLADELASREMIYVGMTRGSESNTAFVICQRLGDEENQNTLDVEPRTLLAEGLRRETAARSATEALRDGLDFSESLRPLTAEWMLTIDEHHQDRCEEIMRRELGPVTYERLEAEGPGSLYRLVRGAELRGHDTRAVLHEAVRLRGFEDADSVAAVMYRRVQGVVAGREPEQDAPDTWAARTPDIGGERGEWLTRQAELMDARQTELGVRAGEQAPEYLVNRLGDVPDAIGERLEREDWQARASIIEAYREAYAVTDERNAIGAAPPEGAVEQRAAWEAAWEALGRPEDERDLAVMTDGQLRDMVEIYDREQEWAPAHVADQMREAYQARDAAARNADLHRATIEGTPDELSQAYEHVAAAYTTQIGMLEEVQAARDNWWQSSAPVREDAEAARMELDRRGVPVVPEPEPTEDAPDRAEADQDQAAPRQAAPEQPALFDLSAELERAREAQRQLTEQQAAAERGAAQRAQQAKTAAERAEQQGTAVFLGAAVVEAELAAQEAGTIQPPAQDGPGGAAISRGDDWGMDHELTW